MKYRNFRVYQYYDYQTLSYKNFTIFAVLQNFEVKRFNLKQ